MKKVFVYVFLVLILFTSCVSNKIEYTDALYELDAYFDINDPYYGPYVDIQIADSTYQAFFDVGDYNGGIVIPLSDIEKHGLEVTGTEKSMRIHTDIIESNVYTVPKMSIENVVFVENVRCAELDTPSGLFEAIIGMETLKESYNVLISFNDEKIYVYDKNYNPDFLLEWTKLQFSEENEASVKGIMDGKEAIFSLDTGASFPWEGKVYDISLNQLEDYTNVKFTLGDRTFKTNFHYQEAEQRDLIPMDYFVGSIYYNYDVFIDFDESTIYIEN